MGEVKILFLSTAGFPDYQHDIVFHGGRSLFGEDFVDYQKVWHQYKDDKEIVRRINEGMDPFDRFPLKYCEIDDTYPDWVYKNF